MGLLNFFLKKMKNNIINYIIQHNRVVEVEKITDNDKKNGKLSHWINYTTWDEVYILDIDYGKSQELMRTLIEGTPHRRGMIIPIVLWVLFTFICIFFLSSFLWKKEEVKNPITTPAPSATVVNNNNEQPLILRPEGEKIQVTSSSDDDVKKIEDDYNSLLLSYNLLLSENSLNKEQKEITQEENKELKEKIKILENENSLIREELENTKKIDNSKNWFLLYLGEEIYKKCEVEKNNYCKELYYRFINN